LGERVPPSLPAEQGLHGTADGVPFEPALTRVDLADAGHQEVVRHLFEHHATHAEAAGLEGLIDVQRGGQEHDPDGARLLGEFPEHGPAIRARQAEIEDQDIGAVLTHGLEGLRPIAAAGHDVAVIFSVQEVLQSRQDEGVGISEYKTDRHRELQAASAARGLSGTIRMVPAAVYGCLFGTDPIKLYRGLV
jgi:hypothetical protein